MDNGVSDAMCKERSGNIQKSIDDQNMHTQKSLDELHEKFDSLDKYLRNGITSTQIAHTHCIRGLALGLVIVVAWIGLAKFFGLEVGI